MAPIGIGSMKIQSFNLVVGRFAESITANFLQPIEADPEDQLKSPVGFLLKATGELIGSSVGWRTEVRPGGGEGKPDLGISIEGLLGGFIELKRPGLGARPEKFTGRNRKQWLRFKALPNLIYTDGCEWSLYRTGRLQSRLTLAPNITVSGMSGVDQDVLPDFLILLRDFLSWSPIAPASAEALARFLAPLARMLRDEVSDSLRRDNPTLKALADEWAGLLFPNWKRIAVR